MNYKVVYFTRSGTSKRVAEKIANKLSCEIIQITDDKNYEGIIGYIRGGYYATKNKDVDIKISKKIEPFDELVVVSPLWAGGVVPAIKVFLKSTTIDRVNLVVTSGGSITKNRSGYKSVTDIVKNRNNEDATIDNLVNTLLWFA